MPKCRFGWLIDDPPTAPLSDAASPLRSVRGSRALGLRLFASPAGQPRVRRATDVLVFVPTLIALVALAAAYPPGVFEETLIRFLAAFPDWLEPVWGFLLGAAGVWVAALVIASLIRRRWDIAAQAVLALAFAIVASAIAARIALGDWPSLAPTLGRYAGDPTFPNVRLALAVALVSAVSGHLVQPARRLSHWILLLAAAAAAIGGTAQPSAVAAAFLTGILAGAAMRMAVGVSTGWRSVPDVTAALSELGVPTEGLTRDERQRAGVVSLHARDGAGLALTVKVYGRDAYDNQLLVKLWRTLMYRESGPALGLSRSQAAEHEAFVTMLARQAGAPVPEVVTAGATIDGDALLVLRTTGTALDEYAPEAVGDVHLRAAWAALAVLRKANIAHVDIDPSVILITGDEVQLTSFAGSTVTPTPSQLACDGAQLLASTASVVGVERALAVAVAAVDPEVLAELVPYMQPAALGVPLRRALKAAEIDVDDLREQTATAIGAPPAPLVKVRRVTWGSAVQLALLVLAASAVFSFAAGVDYDQLAEDLRGASWWLVLLGFIVAQLPRVAQSVATLATVPIKLPFGPVYAMQLATGYLNLALPSSLARLAVNVRFFQRQGLPPATAVASGAIDSFASNIVQAALLILLLIFSQASLTLDTGTPDSSGAMHILVVLVAIVVVIVIGSLIAFAVVPRARAALLGRIRKWWPQILATFRSLRSGHRIAQLVLSNVAAEVLFATALGIMAAALGYDVSLADLLLINMSVSLLSSFIPVPGGIGIVEGGIMVGLAGVGVPETTALAIALLYRVATFYLPPVAGWFALRWLQRNSYL